ncbi:hypothetical protein LKM00_26305 [Bacillus wiedmannii]|uniref:hypothetical protein n=1 Tax=Bacillus wiedmannii TaxID=1890302 RepID=UPI001E2C69B4|nr:hypothetical protein [Bacillus wiedmannii]MCC2380913.1 hypothetical protein [Bacillus wiedmannii]MCC2425375.1 hypothetical protein [Bacillus wiedmannii]
MKTNHGNYCRVQLNTVNETVGDPNYGAVKFTQYVNGAPFPQFTHINNINVIAQAGFLPECSPTGGGVQPIPQHCKMWGWWNYPECFQYH